PGEDRMEVFSPEGPPKVWLHYHAVTVLERREAFVGTLANFATRLVVCLSFVLMVLLFDRHTAAVGGIVWGLSLLSALSYILARQRNVSALSEVVKHVAVAVVIIFVSKSIGQWVTAYKL